MKGVEQVVIGSGKAPQLIVVNHRQAASQVIGVAGFFDGLGKTGQRARELLAQYGEQAQGQQHQPDQRKRRFLHDQLQGVGLQARSRVKRHQVPVQHIQARDHRRAMVELQLLGKGAFHIQAWQRRRQVTVLFGRPSGQRGNRQPGVVDDVTVVAAQ